VMPGAGDEGPWKARSPALSRGVSAWTRRTVHTTGGVKRGKKYGHRRGLLACTVAAVVSLLTSRRGPRILYPGEGRARHGPLGANAGAWRCEGRAFGDSYVPQVTSL